MTAVHLHQIAYSPEVLARVEPGYAVLDHLANERSDWYEMFPIRRHLHAQGAVLDENAFYGFFSPKFGSKTGLSHAATVAEVQAAGDVDVVLFSPQPDMGAFFLNVFEQAETFDAGFIAAVEAWLAHAGLAVPPLRGLVMDSRVTVFSNYFAAKPAFWREWLRWQDALFDAAEHGPEAIRGLLTHATSYPGAAQRKVFIQERIASLLLTLQPHWHTHAANPFRMAWSGTRFRDHPELAVMSDALKRAHRDLGFPCYLQAFGRLRQQFQQQAAAPAPAPVPDPVFTGIPTIEAECQALFDAGHDAACMTRMMVGVHEHYKAPGVGTRALFYPGFDRQIEQLAARLAPQHPLAGTRRERGGNTLVIATQIHDVGGHSRVIEDVMRECARPTLVLTDAFQTFRNGVEPLQPWLDQFADTGFLVLRQHNPWDKARELWQLVQRLAPDEILYFQHHQDPVPFVGTLGFEGAKKVLFHHADHNPSLGVTLPGVDHVDFTAELAAVCSAALHRPADVLPLYVADGGLKAFEPRAPGQFSVVTSGTEVKFQRQGPVALSAVVAAALSAVQGSFFHIGPLSDDWQAEIRHALAAQGIAPERFQSLGSVPSLWQTLLGLDAHAYIGSAPVGGARAAVEAQGCGYPLLYYRQPERDSLTALDSIYAEPGLSWQTPDELRQRLQAVSTRLPDASRTARELYETGYSRRHFRTVLSRHAQLNDDEV
jgi:hypothetical protein